MAHLPALLAVLLGMKTLIRYPEVRVAAERDPGSTELRMAEYYLVGTLVSIAVGVTMPLLALYLAALAAP